MSVTAQLEGQTPHSRGGPPHHNHTPVIQGLFPGLQTSGRQDAHGQVLRLKLSPPLTILPQKGLWKPHTPPTNLSLASQVEPTGLTHRLFLLFLPCFRARWANLRGHLEARISRGSLTRVSPAQAFPRWPENQSHCPTSLSPLQGGALPVTSQCTPEMQSSCLLRPFRFRQHKPTGIFLHPRRRYDLKSRTHS